jgi:hypothetical protein
MTDNEFSLLEVLIVQVSAAVLGTVSIAAADWSYHTGHIRQALHSAWVTCSLTATCLPILAWTFKVLLGSGIFSEGLLCTLIGLIFLWVRRNSPKLPLMRKSSRSSLSSTSSSEQIALISKLRG